MPDKVVLEFERPIAELENKITELTALSESGGVALKDEIAALKQKVEELRMQIYSNLTSWQRVQLARHPKRPYTIDYVTNLIEGFIELHGDRQFADDMAILTGFGLFRGRPVCVVGHNKGHNTKENLARNFGSPHPEGFRKAIRVMQHAGRFGLPIFTFLDTAGAYPGIQAEERGQAEAIARNIRDMFALPVPMIVTVIGEGGSGGALGIGVGNRVLMQENAYYSVISPEGCAAILWRSREEAPTASEIMKINAASLLKLGVIDEIIPEPLGGAHHDCKTATEMVGNVIEKHLCELEKMSADQLLDDRYKKFRAMGVFLEEATKGNL